MDRFQFFESESARLLRKAWVSGISAILVASGLLVSPGASYGATSSDYIAIPPFIAQSADKPNVIISLDTSGSMKRPAYGQTGIHWNNDVHDNFDPAAVYYGYFDPTLFYIYDADPDKLFFTEDSVSAKTDGNWSGNFLNWLTMRRFDVVRKVLIGGKVRDRATESIDGENWYVLMGQKEPEDRQFYKSYAGSSGYTPVIYPDGTIFQMADGKVIPAQGTSGNSVQALNLQEKSGASMEIGQVTMDWAVGDAWVDVPFLNTYSTAPAVVAKSVTYNGGQPVISRIRNVTTTGFQIRLQEWEYLDGGHTTEQLFYIVADQGHYDLDLDTGADIEVDAGLVSSSSMLSGSSPMCHTAPKDSVTFNSGFAGTPVIFSGVGSFNGSSAVVSRNDSVGSSGFEYCLQEQKSNGTSIHTAEDLFYVAMRQSSGSLPLSGATAGTAVQVELGDSSGATVDSSWSTINFGTAFSDVPSIVADMQTFLGIDTASLRIADAQWDESGFDVKVEEESSDGSGVGHNTESVGYFAASGLIQYQIRVGIKETDTTNRPGEPKGLLQALDGQMRLGLAVFNYNHADSPTGIYSTSGSSFDSGTFNPCYPDVSKATSERTNWDICKETQVGAPLSDLVEVIEDHPLVWATTPIAETLYMIGQYAGQGNHPSPASDLNSAPWPHSEARQGSPTASSDPAVLSQDNDGATTHPNAGSHAAFQIANDWDPYYYSDVNSKLPCGKVFVLNFNDGAPYTDWDTANGFTVPGDFVADGNGGSGENEALDDVALMLRNQDVRDDLAGHQEIISYYVLAALGADPSEVGATERRRLMEAAANGGFVDQDGDHNPDVAHPSDFVAYVTNNDDNSDLSDGGNCSDKKNEWDEDGDCVPDAFYFANDGFELEAELLAAFQAILKRVASGGASSVLAGSTGGEGAIYQARFQQEESDGTTTAHWTGDVIAMLIDDAGRLREDSNSNDTLDVDPSVDEIIDMCYDDINQIVRVKTSSDAASRPTAAELSVCSQSVFTKNLFSIDHLWSGGDWLAALDDIDVRSQRSYSALSGRYIITGIDGSDGSTRDGRVGSGEEQPFALASFSGIEGLLSAATSTEASNLVDFTRGDGSLAGYREREVVDGLSTATWRLGDIIYSSPVSVAAPAEDYDLIYGGLSFGSTYNRFHTDYLNRRTVVYVGANDGMLHAFNGGYYDSGNQRYLNGAASTTQYALGTELWAYIPYNQLPHMKYLSDPSYGSKDGDHLYGVDFEPRVFDARIFNDSGTSTTGGIDGQTGVSHPYGWGTVLVGSMRFGGGPVDVDLDNDGGVDDTLQNAVFILDVTDPESPPKLLLEYSDPGLGFNMSAPTPVVKNDGSGVDQWYLLLASGTRNVSQPALGIQAGTSTQSTRLHLIDLKSMALESTFGTSGVMDLSGVSDAGDAFVTGMLPVDYNLDTQTDAVYVSTANGSAGSYQGKLYRLTLRNSDGSSAEDSGAYRDISAWSADIFLDGVGPITAIPNAAVDTYGNRWIYVGTGRFLVRNDAVDSTQQAYYGLKEPRSDYGGFTWSPIDKTRLVDVTGIKVNTNGVLSASVDTQTNLSPSSVTTFNGLQYAMTAVQGDPKQPSGTVTANHGWYRNFGQSPRTAYERNVGQGAILGGVLSFTTFEPSGDVCKFEGTSNLYALNFTTGTASHLNPVFGNPDTTSGPVEVDEMVELGMGLVKTVSLHTGQGYVNDKTGSAIAQSSTAQTTLTGQEYMGSVNSGETNWRTEY